MAKSKKFKLNKTQKMIITAFLCMMTIILVLYFNDRNTEDNTEEQAINKAVGIYHNNNWNGKEATLELYNDKTCKYPTMFKGDKCTWEISDNTITIKLGGNTYKATLTKNNIVLYDHVFNRVD